MVDSSYTWPPMCETRYTDEILQIERDMKQPFRLENVNCTVALNEAWDVPTMRSEQQLGHFSLHFIRYTLRSSCTFPFFFSPLLPLFFFYFYHCSRSRWTRNKYLDIFRRNKMAQVNWEVVIDDKLKLMPALLAVLQRCFNVAHERRNRAGLTQSRFVSLSPVTLFAVSDNISSFVREI